jgi:hypothetical protein
MVDHQDVWLKPGAPNRQGSSPAACGGLKPHSVNTASTTISRFAIAPDGTLTLLGSTPFKSGVGIGSTEIRVASDSRDAYVVDNKLAAISAFAVRGGTLTELPSSPVALPAGATPLGIAVSGQADGDR